MLERRRQSILQDLDDAETRLKTATAELAKAQADLAAAQQKADQIRADGKARAAAIRADGEKRTIEAMAALKRMLWLTSMLRVPVSPKNSVARLRWPRSTR